MNREEFCKILRECRQQSEKTMKEIGFELNMLPGDIYRLEKGGNNFAFDKAIDFLKTVECVIKLQNGKSLFIVSDYELLIKWIVAVRAKKYSQRSLAEAATCSYVAIANIERRKNIMRIDIFLKIVDALGYTVTIEKKQ